eukprot:CAMPEP_0118687118 /NCGR_PEP_ID=MMETSP0800-20121206/8201_1 /TAXON_ID=210618 ORGANISM="Striatella unipunctata, Strain CCMP2910" /NCGR_SAMPLE_ID=MMETSP0800 /ASSEMBLY_ACC=CAM_ASM_000638 /LENGTH=164 /DNA_ID=CAMNT_0006584259 /DNA_START=268 /DNA_END=762 /DNA_ORIENTATION=-
MDAIAGYGSDSSEEEEIKPTVSSTTPAVHDAESTTSNKKQKLSRAVPLLPSTFLRDENWCFSSSTSFLSDQHDKTTFNEPQADQEELKNRLDRLYQKYQDSSTGFAHHLKHQDDFGNPHVFDSVVKHFGIREPLGADKFKDFEYVDRLRNAQELARIRQAKEQH